jgi:G3E family GTPase
MTRKAASRGRSPVTLVVGLPGSDKSTFIRRRSQAVVATEVVTVRAAAALAAHLRARRREGPLLVEVRGRVEPMDVLDVFGEAPLARRFELVDVVAILDGARFLPGMFEDQNEPLEPTSSPDLERLVNQIELASTIAVDPHRWPCRREAEIGTDVLRALNPSARIVGFADASPGAPIFEVARCGKDATWLGVPSPEALMSRAVDVMRYQARRPFHPERLASVLDGGWHGVLRSKGFVWIASRGDERGAYVQSGACWRLGPAGPWWDSLPLDEWPDSEEDLADIRRGWNVRTGDRGQELVFIGMGLEANEIRRDLDACLLDRREMAIGPQGWLALPDPLPAWDDDAIEEEQSTELVPIVAPSSAPHPDSRAAR